MADYQTAYDAATVPFGYSWALGLAVGGGVVVWWGMRRLLDFHNDMQGYVRAFRSLLLLGAGGAMFYLACYDWTQYRSLQATMKAGDGVERIEGIVQDHWVKEQTRETSSDVKIEMVEHFRISSVVFKFAQGKREGRYFTNAPEHRVKLYDGMRLRISYIASKNFNKIVKLEIAQ